MALRYLLRALPLLCACNGEGASHGFQAVPGMDASASADAACRAALAGPFVATCDSITQRRCQEWGASLARSGVVYTSCSPGAENGQCQAGDRCAAADGKATCLCGGVGCGGTLVEAGMTVPNVCVSDPPGSTPRCVSPCR